MCVCLPEALACGCWNLILLLFYRCAFLYFCVYFSVVFYSVIIETNLAYHHTLDICVVVVLHDVSWLQYYW